MLDKIIKFSIHNKVVILILTMILIIWGSWSATKLPIDAVPDITNNQVQVITVCPTLAGQEVEQMVTIPIEQSIANIPNLEETRSISRFGLSVITIVFKENVDIYFARQLINERLKEAERLIPIGIGTPTLAPVSTGLGEVYQYIIHPKKGSESKYNAKDLRTIQDWIVARQLNGTQGVAEINSFGGELKQYEVSLNPNKLKALGISISDIFTALEKNNQNTGGAYIDNKPNAYFIRGIGLVTNLEEVKNISLKTNKTGTPIYIKDIAEVKFGNAVRYGAITYNGQVDAVGGIVMMLKGENSATVVTRVKEKLKIIQKSLPDDIIIEPYLDRTDLVKRAIKTVEKNLVEGALIIVFVLVFFLGNLRAGFIVASAIPLSMLFALGMMNLFGISANLMSLGAIDFGLIVDGAVIIVEATLHHLGLRKSIKVLTQAQMDEEVLCSASKIRNSAAFGEIIILIVYLPILTLIGIEGKMFTPMAKTVGFAILGSLLLSLTYIPMMCALCLSKKQSSHLSFSAKMISKVQYLYEPMLKKAINIRHFILAFSFLIFMASIFLFSRMGGEFIPQLNEGDFAFHCILPQGSSLSQSIETSMHASRIIKQFDEVKMVVGKTGSAEVPTDPMPPEASDIMIILKPQKEWKSKKSYPELADQILEKLNLIPGIFFEKNQPIQMRFNELMTGIRQDVAIKIFGENLDSLAFYAQKVKNLVQKVEGATTPQIERTSNLPQININYDRLRLANYGINISDVNDIVSTAFAGKSAGVVYENERRFDLVVRLDSQYRRNIEDVNNLYIPTNDENQIPLSQIATIGYKLEPAQISHEAGRRRIVVGFNISKRDIQSVVNELKEKLNQSIILPYGYYFEFGGQFENLQKASKRLLIAVPIALVLIFLLLYLTFHSWKQALLIFTAIPMSAIGGILALIIRDMPFSISAGIGFIALFGVAVLNGIVLISTFNQLFIEGWDDIVERVIEGTKIRLRPVLMTATVASLGFLPMAISQSAGSEVQKPLATVVIGGLITATLLTLFVLPILYILIFRKKSSKKNLGIKILPVLIFTLLTSPLLTGQTHSKLSVHDAILRAVEHNDLIKSSDLQIQATQSLIKTSHEIPRTELNATLGQNNSLKFDQSYEVIQTIPFPSVFQAKRQFTKSEVIKKEIDKNKHTLELKHQIREQFNQIQFLIENEKKLKQLDSIYLQFFEISKLHVKIGISKRSEMLIAETKKGEIELQLQQNEVSFTAAILKLSSLINDDAYIDKSSFYPYEPIIIEIEPEFLNIEKHPSFDAIIQETDITLKNLEILNNEKFPSLTIGYTNQTLIGFQKIGVEEKYFSSNKRFHSAQIGITLPLQFNVFKAKKQSYLLIAQAKVKEAEHEKNNINCQLKSEIAQYQLLQIRSKTFTDQLIPNGIKILEEADLGYKTGEFSFLEYLQNLQIYIELNLSYLKTIYQLNQSANNIFYLKNE